MSKPSHLILTSSQQKQVTKLAKGTKTTPPVKNARKAAEMLGLPRHQVMLFFEQQNWANFSESSYR